MSKFTATWRQRISNNVVTTNKQHASKSWHHSWSRSLHRPTFCSVMPSSVKHHSVAAWLGLSPAAASSTQVIDVSNVAWHTASVWQHHAALPDVNPLPAAACLLDPSLAAVLMEPDQAALHAAKKYVIKQSECPQVSAEPVAADRDQSASSPAVSRFWCLASKMRNQDLSTASPSQNPDAAVSQLTRYMTEAAEAGTVSGLDFWSSRRASYRSIQPLAEHLLAAPASQAIVEQVFSLCSLLSAGRRNRANRSLEMHVFLKLNGHV